MDNNHEQLKKLSRIFNADKLVTVDDIAEVLKGIIGILANNRKENVVLNSETKGVVNDLLQKSIQENNKLLSAIDGRTSKIKKEVITEFSVKLNEVKSLLKEVEKKKPKDGKDADEEIIVEKVLAQIELPKYKETILDGRPEIVFKINEGKTDDTKIELKQIENGGKLLTQTVLDRAIGILDQRSQFLISKVSNLQQQADNATANVGAIGGTITGGTAGSVLFVNPTGIIAQDNANFFWDNTNNRLGIGTNTPGEKLDVAGNIQSGGYFIMTSDNEGLAGAGGPVGTWIRPKEPNSTFGQILINASGVTSFHDSAGNVQVIFDNGDVGIGTSAPTTLLSLERGGSGAGTVPGLRLSTVGASVGDGPAIDFYFGNLNRIGRIYGVAVNSNRGDIRIATSNVSGFSDILTLTTAGNVGIGTTSPYLKLNVVSDTTVASFDSTFTGDGAVIDLYTPSINAGNFGSISFRSNNSIGTKKIFASIATVFTDKTAGTESGDFIINTLGVGVGAATERLRVTSLGKVGIGTVGTTPDGNLHVMNASAGTVTANANGNLGVFEADSSNGLSILVPDASASSIFFGSPTSNRGAEITWRYSTNLYQIGTRKVGGTVSLMSGNAVEAFTIDASQNVGIGGTGTGRVTIQGNGSNFNLELTNVTDAITAFKMTGGSTTLFMTSRSTYFDIQTNTASKGLALTTAGGVMFVSSTGSVSITGGTTTPIAPTAKLHLAAGTAAVNTAPLKFTSGALLTAAEAGAVEYLTDAYYVTTTTNTIRRILVAGSTGRATAQIAANASVATYTLGATDASYEVSMNVLITTSTLFSFTCECAYTDEGNTARVITLNFTTLAGVISNAALTNAGGAVPYEGVPIHIRCKASTAITLRTQAAGTYTTVTYNIEGNIKQIG